MIALILEIIIAIAISVWLASKFGWIVGVIAFFLLMGITNTALKRDK